MGIKSRTFDPGVATNGVNGAQGSRRGMTMKLTDKEKKKVEELIRNAKSLSEISMLEKALNEGRLPPGVSIDI